MSIPDSNASQTKKALPPCPQCSTEMEAGFLLTPSAYFRSVRWSANWAVDPMELKGERIVPMNLWGSIKIAGYRCRNCRLLMLTY